MNQAAKPPKKAFGRLFAILGKAVASATTGSSAQAHPDTEEPSNRPTVTPQELRQMAAIKRFPNDNAEETRQAHIRYLENKKKDFAKLLKTLKKDKDGLEADEAQLAHSQWWAGRQKETLTREFENILKEERRAMHAQVKKTPQEVEDEPSGGEPNLHARIELLYEAKRKVLVSLREVEDEELGNMDEEKQLKTKREELIRRTQEAEEKLARVEETLVQVSRAMQEQESAQSARKEQVAAPPVEHDESKRKRTAEEAREESQTKKAKLAHGLEEEEPEGEEEEHVRQREEPDREKKTAATNEQDSAQKSTSISLNPNGPVQAEEASREKEVNASESRASTGPATQQTGTSTTSATRDDRQPLSAGTRISLDELEQAVSEMDFKRDDENNICVACPYCDRKDLCDCSNNICMHFVTHLRKCDRPYLCSQNECHQTSLQIGDMRRHFEGRHKELAWSDEIKNECRVSSNIARFNAIRQLIALRAGPLNGKLSFDQLQEQVRDIIITRHANGINTFKCSVCREVLTGVVKSGWSRLVGQHLKSHLTPDCLPFACPARGCKLTTSREAYLKEHFRSAHEELEWTAHEEKKSVLTANVKRLEAIVQGVLAANPDESGLSLDELEAQAGNITFTRTANGVLRMKCSVCTEEIRVNQSEKIRRHLVSHLRQTSLPVRCPEDGCSHMTGRVEFLRKHIHSMHGGKELTKNMEKDCEMLDNTKRLDAIVATIFARRPPKAS